MRDACCIFPHMRNKQTDNKMHTSRRPLCKSLPCFCGTLQSDSASRGTEVCVCVISLRLSLNETRWSKWPMFFLFWACMFVLFGFFCPASSFLSSFLPPPLQNKHRNSEQRQYKQLPLYFHGALKRSGPALNCNSCSLH